MKKKYENPRVKMLNLHIQDSLLLPIGGSGTTGEALAPRFGGMDEFDTIDSSDRASQWGSIWEDESDWNKDVGEGGNEVW